MNFKLCDNFLLVLSGATRSGKSTFVKNMILNKKLFSTYPDEIIIYYQSNPKQYQEIIDKAPAVVKLVEGIPASFNVDPHKKTLLYLDDTTNSIKRNIDSLTDLFCIDSHHSNISVILITHNIFAKEFRIIRLQATYHCLFRNPTDNTAISNFAKQAYYKNQKIFQDAFLDATSTPYEPLFFDAHPCTPEKLRLRSHILETPSVVYTARQ